jgi:hypothetical protein
MDTGLSAPSASHGAFKGHGVMHSDLLHMFESCALDLRRFLARRVQCEAAAADLAQETYLRLARLASTTQVQNVRGFLFQVADNLAVEYLRSRTRFQQRYAGIPSTDLMGPAPLPDRELAAKQELAILEEAIAEMPSGISTASSGTAELRHRGSVGDRSIYRGKAHQQGARSLPLSTRSGAASIRACNGRDIIQPMAPGG